MAQGLEDLGVPGDEPQTMLVVAEHRPFGQEPPKGRIGILEEGRVREIPELSRAPVSHR
jgi:hypothetical protein